MAQVLSQLKFSTCVSAVKWVNKDKVFPDDLTWVNYIKSKKLSNNARDPARHSIQTLREFLTDLLDKTSDARNDGMDLHDHTCRYLQWLLDKQETPPDASKRKRDDLPSGQDMDSVWQLVQHTANHRNFRELYDLPSYGKGWVRTSREGGDVAKRPRLLAVDCEMCSTVDDPRALVKVCVVGEDGDVVLNTIVNPDSQVLDYKTDLTGVNAAALEGVHPSRKHVSRFLNCLLGPNVVLIGHSLHNDLSSLKLDHAPVIDTALLFSYKGLANQRPSLAALAKQLLNLDIRQSTGGRHDPCEDARTAMQLVLHQLENGGDLELEPPQIKVDKEDLRRLLVHGIPANTPTSDLLALFDKPDCPRPELEQCILDKGPDALAPKRLQLVFEHPSAADDAFRGLSGKRSQDCAGRFMKQVDLPKGKSVIVRKNGCHNGLAFGKIRAQQRQQSEQQTAKARSKKKKKTRRAANGRTPDDVDNREGVDGPGNASEMAQNGKAVNDIDNLKPANVTENGGIVVEAERLLAYEGKLPEVMYEEMKKVASKEHDVNGKKKRKKPHAAEDEKEATAVGNGDAVLGQSAGSLEVNGKKKRKKAHGSEDAKAAENGQTGTPEVKSKKKRKKVKGAEQSGAAVSD